MKIEFVVYYTDDSSEVICFEKQPGCHPDSPGVAWSCVTLAERTGKRVLRLGRQKPNPHSRPGQKVVFSGRLSSRDEVASEYRESKS